MKKSSLIYIALAGVLWGTSGIFSYFLTPFGFKPVQMTTMRGVVSMVLLLLFVLIKNPKLLKVPKREIVYIIGSGVGLFFTAYTYFASMAASSVSTAVILMYTAPIFVLIYSVMFLGEKLNTIKCISIFLMIIGCALVSGVVGGMNFNTTGILFGIAAGISYSAYNIFTKILTLHKVDTLTVTSYNFIIMTAIALAVSNPAKIISLTKNEPLTITPLIIGIGVFTCILPYLFYTLGLKDIPAGTATALGIIEPLSATVFSVAFLGEKLTVPLTIGIVLILGAVFTLARTSRDSG